MKRIGLDLDGVMYNYSSIACHLLNHEFGYNLDWTDTNSWGWLETQVDKKHWQWLWNGGVKNGLFRYGHIIKGAIEGVKTLNRVGDIIIITSRPKSSTQDTYDWIGYNRIPAREVHIVSSGSKANIKVDLMIDDAPHNIEDFAKIGVPSFLFDQKYNKEVQETSLIKRVYGWKDIMKIVDGK